MIPLIIGAATALFGAAAVSVANDTQEEANDTLQNARDIYDNAKASLEAQQRCTENSLTYLGNQKYEILTTLIPQFVVAFSKFKNVDFRGSAGINELNNLKIERFSGSDFADIKQLADTGESMKKGAIAGGTAGAIVALGAGTYAVGGVGAVAGIANLFGAGAAASSVLAGAGITSLVPGLAAVAGPALLVGGFASFMKADENLEKAKSALAQSRTAAEQMDNAEYMCRQIERRSDMLSDNLAELEPLFQKCVDELTRIAGVTCTMTITKKPPSILKFLAGLFKIELKDKTVTKKVQKNDYKNLTVEEKQFLAMSGSIAKAVKAIIDTPVLDADGDVTYESEELCDEMDDKIPEFENQQQYLLAKIS